jgi:hypothetical protein
VSVIFLAVTACSSIHGYGRFGGMCLVQDRGVIQARNGDLNVGVVMRSSETSVDVC